MDIINLHKYMEETNNCQESGVIWQAKTTLLLPGCSDTVKNSHYKKQSSQREWSSF